MIIAVIMVKGKCDHHIGPAHSDSSKKTVTSVVVASTKCFQVINGIILLPTQVRGMEHVMGKRCSHSGSNMGASCGAANSLKREFCG